jgi:hypothetical protein
MQHAAMQRAVLPGLNAALCLMHLIPEPASGRAGHRQRGLCMPLWEKTSRSILFDCLAFSQMRFNQLLVRWHYQILVAAHDWHELIMN